MIHVANIGIAICIYIFKLNLLCYGIMQKLKQIESLKKQQEEGKVLEANQVCMVFDFVNDCA